MAQAAVKSAPVAKKVKSAAVAASSVPPALSASARSVPQGSPVTFDFATPSNLLATDDFIGLYTNGNTTTSAVDFPAGGVRGAVSEWAYALTGTTTAPAAGAAPATDGKVTFSTAGLAPGVYTAYYEFDTVGNGGANQGGTAGGVIGEPVTLQVTPAAQPTLRASAAVVTQGASVSVKFSTPTGSLSADNVLAWYSNTHTAQDNASATSDTPDLAAFAQTGTTTAPASGATPTADGTATFSTAGLTPGIYTVDFFANTGDTISGDTLAGDTALGAVTVRVNPVPVPAGTLAASSHTLNAGDPISFAYTMPSGDVNTSDRIEWLNHGADRLTSQPVAAFNKTVGTASGSMSFVTNGLTGGGYDVYLVAANNAVIAGPVTLTVRNTGPQLPSPGQIPARPNLIVNGGGEIGAATLDGGAMTGVPGWTTTGSLNEVQYGASGGYPAFGSPGSANRGQNFLAAAGGGTSTGTQTVNLAKAAADINRGNVRFNLGGWLGGSGSSSDAASVKATFLSARGAALGTASLAPVTPAMRGGTTELLPENDTGVLPKGTTSARVTVSVTGSLGQGFADNLSFTISSDAVPAPVTPSAPTLDKPPAAAGAAGGDPNLIVNGDAELGHGELDGNEQTSVPGWTTTGVLGETRYGASDSEGIGNWPTSTTPGPTDRGQNFFDGGSGGTSTGTQVIDVSKAAAQINAGTVSYNLSGWIGGAASQPDDAGVTATFLSATGASLGTAALAPVTPAMRNDTTELLSENAVGTLPKLTTAVRVVMTIVGNLPNNRAGHGQGFVDDLSFTLSTAAVPAPPPPTPPKSTVPAFDHVFVIMMENQDSNRVIGNTTQAPFVNNLLKMGANLTNTYGVSHPSDENYTALSAGSTYTQTGNTENAQIAAQQIGDYLSNAGMTWRNYMTLANGPCDTTGHDSYEIDDNPFHQFQDVANNQAACQEHEAPLSDFAQDLKSTATTPAFSWLGPNGCAEGDNEGCGIAIGDQWQEQTLQTLFNSPAWKDQRSLLIITYDENAPDQGSPQSGPTTDYTPELIPGVVVGSQGTVKAGSVSSVKYSLYSITRTAELALGLPAMTGNDLYAQPYTGIWGVPPRS